MLLCLAIISTDNCAPFFARWGVRPNFPPWEVRPRFLKLREGVEQAPTRHFQSGLGRTAKHPAFSPDYKSTNATKDRTPSRFRTTRPGWPHKPSSTKE